MRFAIHALLCCCAALQLGAAAAPARAAGDAEHGQQLYRSLCAACHSVDFNGVGPAHKGVFGRRAGQAPGFAYSPALRNASVIWTEDTLNRWLSDPEALLPGQRMGFSVAAEADRADLIAYLKRISARE